MHPCKYFLRPLHKSAAQSFTSYYFFPQQIRQIAKGYPSTICLYICASIALYSIHCKKTQLSYITYRLSNKNLHNLQQFTHFHIFLFFKYSLIILYIHLSKSSEASSIALSKDIGSLTIEKTAVIPSSYKASSI